MIEPLSLMTPQKFVARVLCGIVRSYRRFISPLFPRSCRFQPSCSAYALEALEKKPLAAALKCIVIRLAKCHPFHPGGYDPLK